MVDFRVICFLCLGQALFYLSQAANINNQQDDPYSSSGVQCYDCNYDPEGGNPQAGSSHCALKTAVDASRIDQWSCTAGMCFVRKDPNGLVYRGCADPSMLPLNVDVTKDCLPQGPDKSYWKFCEGNLCNGGDVDCETGSDDSGTDNEVGAGVYDVEKSGYDSDPAETGYGVPVLNLYDVDVGYDADGYHINVPYDVGNTIFGKNRDYGVDAREGSQGDQFGVYSSSDRYYPQGYYEEGNADSTYGEPEYAGSITDTDGLEQPEAKEGYPTYNPCDGKCTDNPSGLFADPSRDDRFIQCGVSDEGSTACTCCRMFYVNCPHSTRFDDVTKVCVGQEMYSQMHGRAMGPSEHW